MVERRTLEDVLNDLKKAEDEYKEKCLRYGITEKHKKKKDEGGQDLVTGENGEYIEFSNNEENIETNEEEIKNNEQEVSEN